MAELRSKSMPRVAFSLEGEPAGLPLFAEGLREGGGPGMEWIANPGGPEQVLGALGREGPLHGVIGSFAGEAWLDAERQRQVVNMEWLSRVEGVCSVGLDWCAAGALAAKVLREVGVLCLGFVGVRGQFASRELLRGMVEAGGGVAEAPAPASGLPDWLRTLPKPAGVLCATPSAALRVLRAAGSVGLDVPEELAALAMGDTGLASIQGGVELSSLPIPWRQLGEEAARLMQALLEAGVQPGRRMLISPVAPVLRASSLRRGAREVALEQVIRLLPGWVAENPSVDDLARRAGMSRRAFEVKFRERVGESPFQAMQAMRLEEAKELLRNTDLAASEVGWRCGYTEPQVFSSAFKRALGCSPLAWRKRNR